NRALAWLRCGPPKPQRRYNIRISSIAFFEWQKVSKRIRRRGAAIVKGAMEGNRLAQQYLEQCLGQSKEQARDAGGSAASGAGHQTDDGCADGNEAAPAGCT